MIRATLIVAMAWAVLVVHAHSSEAMKVAGVAALAALLLPAASGALRRLPLLPAIAVTVLASSCLAIEPAVWIGSNARAQGALLALALLVLAAAASLLSVVDRDSVRRAAAVIGGLAAAHALVQSAGLDPLSWRSGVDGRAMATLSNATSLAGLLILLLPATLACALQPGRGRAPMLALALLQVAALIASGTRSALLALAAAALGAWLLGQLLRGGASAPDARRARQKLIALLLPAAVVVALLVAWRPASLQDRAYLWRSAVRALSLPEPIVDLKGHADARFALRPWLGYGLDLQQPALTAAAASTPGARGDAQGWIVDRAHQGVLDRALEMGVAGLLAGLALVLAVLRALWQAWCTGDPGLRREASVLAIALGAWLIHLQASFALSGDRTLAWVWIGMALALGRSAPAQAADAGRNRGARQRWLRAAAVVPAAALLVGALAAGGGLPAGLAERLAPALRAEHEYASGQAAYVQGLTLAGPQGAARMDAAARAFERAAQLRRHDPDAALAAASARVELAAMTAAAAELATARAWADAARRLVPADRRLGALDARIAAVAGRLPSGDR